MTLYIYFIDTRLTYLDLLLDTILDILYTTILYTRLYTSIPL